MVDQSIKEPISTPSRSVFTVVVMSLSPNPAAQWDSSPSGLKGPHMGRNFVAFKNEAES